ncbi:MAG: N-acetylmuramoyl-L-alanine amidase [Kofleriaceae bacterium]
MRKLSPRVLLISCIVAITGCSVGDEAEPFDDIESDVVILEGDELSDELAASPIRIANEPFVRLGFLYDADSATALEVSTSDNGVDWTPYISPTVHHTEVEGVSNFVGQIELPTAVKFYRLRSITAGTVGFVHMEMMTYRQSEQIESGDDTQPQQPSIARTVGGMTVNSRADWGARASNCSSGIGNVYRMAIHHTETPTNDSMSPQARLRQIQSYHMDVKGWCDIGYHYLVSRDGRIWDGRPDTKLGAHAGGANTGNLGISVMGSHDSTTITQTQLDSIAGLVKALASIHGVAINRSSIKGHREYTSTSCPGNALYGQLGAIVAAANGAAPGGGMPGGGMSGGCELATDAPWSCSGLTGRTTNAAGTYYTTSFGCWVDSNNTPRGDAGDNCIPACSLATIGCSGLTGPQCERMHNYYTAGSDRFGCGTKVKVTNPDNNKSVVLISIDRGPNCTIENNVDFWVLDMSYPASNYLFGGPTSATERANVQVEVVDDSIPVGPHNGSAVCVGDGMGGGGGGGGTTMPGTVTVMGVLYVGSNTANRIAGATVTLGSRTTTTSATGLWQFDDVPAGSFTVTASAPGYMTRSLTRMTDSAETWASFGLSVGGMATGSAILQGVIYYGSSSANRIANAQVTFSNGTSTTADGNGYYKVENMPAGAITITASAPGYSPASVQRTLADGVTEWGSVKLAP